MHIPMASRTNSSPNNPDVLIHVQQLLEAFTAFDSDDDGLISSAELEAILSSIGYNATEQEVRVMMSQADTDGDGQLNLDEFLEVGLKDMDLGNLASVLKSVLETMDTVNQGDNINGSTLYDLVSSLGAGMSKEECEALIVAFDMDGDGMVGLDDFKTIATALL